MSQPIRVAHIIGKMVNGGVESVVMNYYRYVDRTRVQFDFYIDEDFTNEFKVIPPEEVRQLGGRIIIVPPYQQLNRYIPTLTKLFRENEYKIVHSHINTLSVFPLYAAKKAGVPIRIAHNHSTAAKGEWKKNILKYSLRPFAKVYATHYAACSKTAGKWLFGEKSMERGEVTIFNNAIDLEKYKFDPVVREEVRKEFGVEDKFVVGHVGRFCYDKNHDFLIDVFKKVYEKDPNSVLLLVGDGEERKHIEEKVKRIGAGGVIFLGNRNDAYRLYQAMDIFVLPSRIEGFPVVGVEAQANGMPVLFSDNVPYEARITDQVMFLPLQAGAEQWASAIIATRGSKRECQKNMQQFDIAYQSNGLIDYYEVRLNELTEKPGKRL